MGFTVNFEYVGMQSRIKVNYAATQLVVTAIRHKYTGVYMNFEVMQSVTQQFRIPIVQPVTELLNQTVGKAIEMIGEWTFLEGAVLILENGLWIKLKSEWWASDQTNPIKRWASLGDLMLTRMTHFKRVAFMHTKALRFLVNGYPAQESPSHLLTLFPSASKVEAFYSRSNGKLGSIILSFMNDTAISDALIASKARSIRLKQAYSNRSHDNEYRYHMTWVTWVPKTMPRPDAAS